ncbi:MAG: hypothetical protein ABSG43_01085 [Solirubrobacteraceae bacterium]
MTVAGAVGDECRARPWMRRAGTTAVKALLGSSAAGRNAGYLPRSIDATGAGCRCGRTVPRLPLPAITTATRPANGKPVTAAVRTEGRRGRLAVASGTFAGRLALPPAA